MTVAISKETIVTDIPLEDILDLLLSRLTGQLSVTVNLTPAWIPLGQRDVVVSVIGEGQNQSAVSSGGPVTFNDLPAGDYIVFAEREGFEQGRTQITLNAEQPNAALDISIALKSLQEARLDLSGVPLNGDNLREINDLRGADLSGALLANADLCGLNLSGVILAGTNLLNANLSGANLTGARMDNAILEGASLIGTHLNSASLFGANLRSAQLHNGVPSCDSEFRQSSLLNANLSFADLTGAILTDGEITDGSNTCDPNSLYSPAFTGTIWTQANLIDAVMNGVRFQGSNLNNTTLNGAFLNQACLKDATLLRSDFSTAEMNGVNLSNASLIDTLMNEVNAQNAILDGVIFSGVNLSQAIFDGSSASTPASFTAVIFDDSSFQNTDLSGSFLVGAFFNRVNFSSAVMTGADLRNSAVIDSLFNDVDCSIISLSIIENFPPIYVCWAKPS